MINTVAKITEAVVAININQSYKYGMSSNDLYESTRGIWRLSKTRVENAKYVLAVYRGKIKEVYQIDSWFRGNSTPYSTRIHDPEIAKKRFEFTGKVAPDVVRDKYLEKEMPARQSQNPIRYYNC